MKKLLLGVIALTTIASSYAGECKLEQYSGLFYISADGNYLSEGTIYIDSALESMRELNSYGICDQPTPRDRCEITRFSSKFYITLNGDYKSTGFKAVENANIFKTKLINNGFCLNNVAKHECKMERYSSKWYITAGGNYMTKGYDSLPKVSAAATKLANANICFKKGYTPALHVSYSANNQSSTNYVFDFRNSSADIGNRIINLTKTLEPYVNNAHERELDQMKRKAARLVARANTRDLRKLTETATELEVILDRNEAYMLELLETDALDSLSLEIITITENLKALLDYLVNDSYADQNQTQRRN